MDFIIRNDNPDFLCNKLTTVEKLGHAYQMNAVWTKTQKLYLQLKKNPPSNIDQVWQNKFLQTIIEKYIVFNSYNGSSKKHLFKVLKQNLPFYAQKYTKSDDF